MASKHFNWSVKKNLDKENPVLMFRAPFAQSHTLEIGEESEVRELFEFL